MNSLTEIAGIFLRLGATAFGGPLAHIALMRSEFVDRRKWLSDQEFLDLNGAVNLVPGPNSTELAMHIGHLRGGTRGLFVAGFCFIFPAFVMVLLLAELYRRFGTLPAAQAILWGVSPVVVAVVVQALWKFAPVALKSQRGQIIAALALGGAFFGLSEITLIFAAAALGLLWAAKSRSINKQNQSKELADFRAASVELQNSSDELQNSSPVQHNASDELHNASDELRSAAQQLRETSDELRSASDELRSASDERRDASGLPAILLVGGGAASPLLGAVFFEFLKMGCLVYGSGYVLLVYLRSQLVENRGWISEQTLIDAISVGQVTPGPVFTSATFLGYQIAGFWGAVAATVGIFAPSFGFVMLLASALKRFQNNPKARVFLDCVNAASFALMVIVTLQLAQAALFPNGPFDARAALILVFSSALLLFTKINSAFLLVAGALAGLIRGVVSGQIAVA